jgi:hypothetical protein
MAKRKPLSFDSKQLTRDLTQSTGKGVDAFFSADSPSPPTPIDRNQPDIAESPSEQEPVAKQSPIKGRSSRERKGAHTRMKANRLASKQANKQASLQASNTPFLLLDDADVAHLKEAAIMTATYRFAERELEWIRDTAHRLSKEIQQGKVTQVDIVRVAIKLMENALATNKADLLKIFERMK